MTRPATSAGSRPGDLEALDIHPTQWRQLRDWLTRAWPHVE